MKKDLSEFIDSGEGGVAGGGAGGFDAPEQCLLMHQ